MYVREGLRALGAQSIKGRISESATATIIHGESLTVSHEGTCGLPLFYPTFFFFTLSAYALRSNSKQKPALGSSKFLAADQGGFLFLKLLRRTRPAILAVRYGFKNRRETDEDIDDHREH